MSSVNLYVGKGAIWRGTPPIIMIEQLRINRSLARMRKNSLIEILIVFIEAGHAYSGSLGTSIAANADRRVPTNGVPETS